MSIDPEHEKAYSPSAWSKRYAGLDAMSQLLQLANEAVKEARRTVPYELDVPYGSSDRATYDIYGTNLPNDAPVYIFIHGGYWQECSKECAGFEVSNFVARGIKVFIIGYDLCPEVTLTDIVTQIKTAVGQILNICKKNNGNNVWISGHSAGAHLAASLLHDDEWRTLMIQQNLFQLIKGFVLIGGIYSLRPLLKTSYSASLHLTDDEIKKFSFNDIDTSKFESLNNIKVIVAVGECDSPKFIEESRNYAKKLLNFVDRVEYLLLRNDTDHFDIFENLRDTKFVLTKLIIDSIIQ